MSETDTNTPDNIIPLPTEAPVASADAPASEQTEQPKPQTIQELVAAIDISGVSEHEIITDLIAGIQQLALRGTIALGLLERIKVRDDSATAEAEAAAADADAEVAP
jgi:hypothetical protein